LLDASEVVEFADCHSGATQAAPGQLNPYKLGLDLFRHAERRGLDVFRLRAVHNDVSFVDEVLDEEFVAESSLFVKDAPRRGTAARISSRDAHEVKQALLHSLAWGGQPRIQLVEVSDGPKRELVLRHDHDGRDLKLDEAGEMLRTIEGLWKGPVHLLTLEGEERRRLTSEGGELRMRDDESGKSTPAKAG
jgi:stage V sporulation protein R